jgi:integrase
MHTMTEQHIAAYLSHLADEERAPATVEKYGRALRVFSAWLGENPATKEAVVAYKKLCAGAGKAATVNGILAALNGFFAFQGWDVKVKPLRIQRQTYLTSDRELSKDEYRRLVEAALRRRNDRLSLVLQTLCATGIRVSELRYITVEAARSGHTEAANKGKTRTVFLPRRLQTALLRYAASRGIKSGCVFITRTGKPLNRSNVWGEMKKLCAAADIPPAKVFPHNLRHLFARVFYDTDKDIMRLADVLGHSSVNTTRIYIMESGQSHRRLVDRLDLVLRL